MCVSRGLDRYEFSTKWMILDEDHLETIKARMCQSRCQFQFFADVGVEMVVSPNDNEGIRSNLLQHKGYKIKY